MEREEGGLDRSDKFYLVGQLIPDKSLKPIISVLWGISKEFDILGKDDLEGILCGKLHGGINNWIKFEF